MKVTEYIKEYTIKVIPTSESADEFLKCANSCG